MQNTNNQMAYWEQEAKWYMEQCNNSVLYTAGFDNLTDEEKSDIAREVARQILNDDYVWERINQAIQEHIISLTLNLKFPLAIREHFNDELEDDETDEGGTSYAGETLENFLLEALTSTPKHAGQYTPVEINAMLIECGIKPIKF